MTIVLLGVKGVGKTTVGKKLAEAMGASFVDTDWEMERREGCGVREIFVREGERRFRELEREVLASVGGGVVAVGGGGFLGEENKRILRGMGRLVCLYMRKEEVWARWKEPPPSCLNFDRYYEERMRALTTLSCVWIDAMRDDLVPILLRVCHG